MKNISIVLLCIVALTLTAEGQALKVPEAVKKAFNAKFPNATNVKWGKENAKEYEAEFKLNGSAISSNFKQDGSWVETESVIPNSEVPTAVTTAVTSKYKGAVIIKSEKTEMPNNKIEYEITFTFNGKKRSVKLKPDGSSTK